jgi:exonuclease VII small subunit
MGNSTRRKVSAEGTTWGVLAQHYDFDNFADRGPRLVEVVHSFDSVEEAKTWMASDRTRVTPEWPDPKEHLEKTVASVISVPGFEDELLKDGSTLESFQRDCAKCGSFMELPDAYKVAILWAEQEIMARKFGEISVPAGDEVKKAPDAELAAAESALDNLIQCRREQLDNTSEDSYATRNELRDEIAQLGQFLQKVKSAELGEVLDFTRKIADYGYDPEAAASDAACGLEYVSNFQRAKEVYESCLDEISPIIENLERAGIRVETGVTSIAPPDYGERWREAEREYWPEESRVEMDM